MNAIQEQIKKNASSSVGTSGFHTFHAAIGHGIFNPWKYGAALGKKVSAVLAEGAVENPEFVKLLEQFATEGLTLVAVSSIAVSHKGMNPSQDADVIKTLEELVLIAAQFIPLIEKLYSSNEGKVPEPEQSETDLVPVDTKEEDNENDELAKQTSGQEEPKSASSFTIEQEKSTRAVPKFVAPIPPKSRNSSTDTKPPIDTTATDTTEDNGQSNT